MNKESRSGYRTLLMSVLLSAPGPLVLGMALMVGHSSTQISDFTRRTAELFALIVSFAVYTVTNKRADMDDDRKAELERKGNTFAGAVMCISGLSMVIMALLSTESDKGNVIPALAIAVLGAVTNTFFWWKYTILHRKSGNSILGVQSRLYRAKSCVDICVTAALAAVLLFPGTKVSLYLDTAGSLAVAIYMLYCGIRTIKEFRTV